MQISLELRNSVDVSLESAVDDFCALIVKERHNWLVHAAVPLHVSRLSVSVPVCGSVVLVVGWSLSCSPLSVSVGHRRVSRQDSGDGPVQQVWVVGQCLCVQGMVVHDDRSCPHKASAQTSGHKPHDPTISNPAPHVEILNGKFSDEEQAKNASDLRSGRVVSPVEVRSIDRSCNHILHPLLSEPATKLISNKLCKFLTTARSFSALGVH